MLTLAPACMCLDVCVCMSVCQFYAAGLFIAYIRKRSTSHIYGLGTSMDTQYNGCTPIHTLTVPLRLFWIVFLFFFFSLYARLPFWPYYCYRPDGAIYRRVSITMYNLDHSLSCRYTLYCRIGRHNITWIVMETTKQ